MGDIRLYTQVKPGIVSSNPNYNSLSHDNLFIDYALQPFFSNKSALMTCHVTISPGLNMY